MEQGAQLGRGLCPQQRPLRWRRRAVWMEEKFPCGVWSSSQALSDTHYYSWHEVCECSSLSNSASGSGKHKWAVVLVLLLFLLVPVGQWLLS